MAKLIEQIAGIMTIVSFLGFIAFGVRLLLESFWLFPGKKSIEESH